MGIQGNYRGAEGLIEGAPWRCPAHPSTMTTMSILRSIYAGAAALAVASPAVAPPAFAPPAFAQERMPVPWDVGEKLEYQVKFSFLTVGTGSMEVVGIEPIRGRNAWHTQFRMEGSKFGYDVSYLFDSWGDVTSFASLRFHSDADQNGKERVKRYEIFPDRTVYVEETPNANGTAEQKSVENPLDDGSFLYFIRTVPLEVGKTYEFQRYFRPDRNPVRIKVLRKERVRVPAGTFNAIVIQPVIKTKGIFSENGHAEIWLSDDDRHIMLQLKSRLSFGSLNLYLKSYYPSPSR